jgi:hypothetical protein
LVAKHKKDKEMAELEIEEKKIMMKRLDIEFKEILGQKSIGKK